MTRCRTWRVVDALAQDRLHVVRPNKREVGRHIVHGRMAAGVEVARDEIPSAGMAGVHVACVQVRARQARARRDALALVVICSALRVRVAVPVLVVAAMVRERCQPLVPLQLGALILST